MKEKSKGRLAIENLDKISESIIEDLAEDGASSLPYDYLLKYFDVYLKISKVKREIYENGQVQFEDAL